MTIIRHVPRILRLNRFTLLLLGILLLLLIINWWFGPFLILQRRGRRLCTSYRYRAIHLSIGNIAIILSIGIVSRGPGHLVLHVIPFLRQVLLNMLIHFIVRILIFWSGNYRGSHMVTIKFYSIEIHYITGTLCVTLKVFSAIFMLIRVRYIGTWFSLFVVMILLWILAH